MTQRIQSVKSCDRCMAKRADGQRCSRRHKPNQKFCGTHCKGTPNGIYCQNDEQAVVWNKEHLSVIEVRGIPYFINAQGKVYLHRDVLAGIKGPKVIGTYTDGNLVFM